VVAERIPQEELDEPIDQNSYISVFHFQNEPSRAHGMPFKFLLKEGEKFSETKKRLEKRTGLKGKSFEKIKFAVVRRQRFSQPQYLTDGKSHRVSSCLAVANDDMQTMFYGMPPLAKTTTSAWIIPIDRGHCVTALEICSSRDRQRLDLPSRTFFVFFGAGRSGFHILMPVRIGFTARLFKQKGLSGAMVLARLGHCIWLGQGRAMGR
jgi:hypothetical protein